MRLISTCVLAPELIRENVVYHVDFVDLFFSTFETNPLGILIQYILPKMTTSS